MPTDTSTGTPTGWGAPTRDVGPALPFTASCFDEVTLAEVMADAARLTRVDRKYLVPTDVARVVLGRLVGSHRLLVVAGRPATTYRSTYFDTTDLQTARAHVQGRRRRWKARSRLYVEDGLCRLEVKTRDGRGVTTKTVRDADPDAFGSLRPRDVGFVDDVLRGSGLPARSGPLRPSAEVGYRRATWAHLEGATRLTLDWQVVCTLASGTVRVDPAYVLLETKGGLRPGIADRVLAGLGVRPTSFSKYVAGVALLEGGIAGNDFVSLCGRQLHRTPIEPVEERTA